MCWEVAAASARARLERSRCEVRQFHLILFFRHCNELKWSSKLFLTKLSTFSFVELAPE